MTTAQQRRLYFPAWNNAARNHGWHKAGLWRGAEPFFGSPMLNPIYQRICAIALERSPSGPCGEHFRHACHIVAFGQDKSSSTLTNRELDRILALFALLADPDDLDAMLRWNNPEQEARKRMLWWLRKNCEPAYIAQIAREKFATDRWETLDYEDLRKLHMTLKNRPNAQRPNKAARVSKRSASTVNVAREMQPAETSTPF